MGNVVETVFLTRFTTRETPKPVSQLFGFTSERDTHTDTQTHRQTDRHTHIIKFEAHLHKRPFGQKSRKSSQNKPATHTHSPNINQNSEVYFAY